MKLPVRTPAFLAIAFLAALLAGQQAAAGARQRPADDIDLGAAQRELVEAAILTAFPNVSGWRLSEAGLGWSSTAELDRRIQVDIEAPTTDGRIERQPRFDCVRRRASGAWSCGERWQMLWQVERVGTSAGRCSGPVVGLDATGAASEDVILDVVDFFSYPATANAALTAGGKCRAIKPETLCRPSVLGDGEPLRSDGEPADLSVRFRSGPSSFMVVRLRRHCDGTGPCLLDPVDCWAESAD